MISGLLIKYAIIFFLIGIGLNLIIKKIEKGKKLEQNKKTLTATQLGEKYALNARQINSILMELGWVSKSKAWWLVTKEGERAGGFQQYNEKSKIKYVVWEEKIMDNKIFQGAIQELKGETKSEEKTTNESTNNFREKFEAKNRTADGHYVRSRAETIIDNWLYQAGIVHAYERKLPVEEEIYCDFFLPNGRIYIEFWGMEDNEKYAERKRKKIEIYKKYEYNLIELNDKDIENIEDILTAKLLKYGIKVE